MDEIESYRETDDVGQNEYATKKTSYQHAKNMSPKNKDNTKRSRIEGQHENRYWDLLTIPISFILET